ncbi:TIGR03086 family metal-binding protein [Actinoplanes derwentensis]|uniref:TIGR03086 family protein n=1 Tax=Actinoplanes derwentensis TaxID=113562 RepID=A0A1H1WPX6_9ACTN|nr:TIGR03086 family metal-binding protein [Actinoplanes derwentensis]GID87045.1 TIGR03086 family protein [Actinoplanes derwentensis]SDS98416.1 TIGR03086 family protein [Actinoplanes derwentensis]
MSTEISDLLGKAVPVVTALVARVRDEQLPAVTPCAEFTVRDLLSHLFQVVRNFQLVADRKEVDWGVTPDSLVGDWRADFASEAHQMIIAWADPAVLDGVSPGMGLPHRTLGLMMVVDLVVHGWDLSRAIGQPYPVDVSLLPAVAEFLDTMGDMGRKMGAFGPAVPVPADADRLARLIAGTGRDPAWQPA